MLVSSSMQPSTLSVLLLPGLSILSMTSLPQHDLKGNGEPPGSFWQSSCFGFLHLFCTPLLYILCISYLLLSNKLSCLKHLVLLSFCRSGIRWDQAGILWLGDSDEAVVPSKDLLGHSLLPCPLTWAEVDSCQLLARDVSSWPPGTLHRVVHNMAASFSQNEWQNDSKCSSQKPAFL